MMRAGEAVTGGGVEEWFRTQEALETGAWFQIHLQTAWPLVSF